jgi:hypothetical protein
MIRRRTCVARICCRSGRRTLSCWDGDGVFWRDVEASDVQEDGGLSTTVFVDAASDAMVCERLGGGGGTAGGAITVRFAGGEG